MAEETPTSTLEEAVQVGHIGQLPPDSPDRSTLGQPAQLENYAGPASSGASTEEPPDPLEGMSRGGGYYELPDGSKHRGREAALSALEAYEAAEAAKAGGNGGDGS